MSANKDYRPLVVELQNQGWTVEQTTQGHYRAAPPDRAKGIVHFSMSNEHHALRNTIRDLRKSGFQWPPPSKKEEASDRRSDADVSNPNSPDALVAALEAQLTEEDDETFCQSCHEAVDVPVGSTCPRCGSHGAVVSRAYYGLPPEPVTPPRPETSEERMDRLYSELKDAKTYLSLADEHLAACRRTLEEATKAFADAQAERSKAEQALTTKRAEFMGVFEAA